MKTSEFYVKLGVNITTWRLHRGMSLSALAEASETGKQTLVAAERGRPLGVAQLVRIAAALDVDLYQLLPPSKLSSSATGAKVAIFVQRHAHKVKTLEQAHWLINCLCFLALGGWKSYTRFVNMYEAVEPKLPWPRGEKPNGT